MTTLPPTEKKRRTAAGAPGDAGTLANSLRLVATRNLPQSLELLVLARLGLAECVALTTLSKDMYQLVQQYLRQMHSYHLLRGDSLASLPLLRFSRQLRSILIYVALDEAHVQRVHSSLLSAIANNEQTMEELVVAWAELMTAQMLSRLAACPSLTAFKMPFQRVRSPSDDLAWLRSPELKEPDAEYNAVVHLALVPASVDARAESDRSCFLQRSR
jgi:hypothetical protein